ncbi:MAG: bifunctional glutamate N-acetyltransferase/amino-acid acetyltransferase ArgJ [Proteobacteria bacterium]|nr:bifunctional glutamate N-acetyltransferase/amino-acid acetyltransferase ArgJ [Pseudomonadota bacterium]
MPPVAGVRLASTEAGIRYQGRSDLLLVELAPGSAVAGVFTRSSTASAPVEWSRRVVRGGQVRAILVNSGNANAFTGRAGHKTVARTAEATAYLLGCPRREVLVASTGVIGEPLEAEKTLQALPNLGGRLMPRGWPAAARAIMTTDTFPKGATRGARIARQRVVINGIAKGSGMIAPDMATMLAFIFTDARLPAPVLRTLLRRATRRSFNAITVDSDTSTSDTCLLVATGQTSVRPRVASAGDRRLDDFRYALEELMTDLAQQIVRDGEGAQKFVTITVSGARSEDAARRIGLSIGNSPLVKTAIAGEDPNWGRIVMAVGKSGEAADRDGLEIRIGGHLVASEGDVDPNYDEAAVARHMKGRAIAIEVDVAVGRGRATVWTCDLTRGYIEINADYRS